MAYSIDACFTDFHCTSAQWQIQCTLHEALPACEFVMDNILACISM